MNEEKQIEGENENRAVRELLPCPFCGGEAEYNATSRKVSGDLRGFGFTIMCKRCGVKLPKTFEIDFRLNGKGEIEVEGKDARECAARMWNTRTENKQ